MEKENKYLMKLKHLDLICGKLFESEVKENKWKLVKVNSGIWWRFWTMLFGLII